MRFGAGWSAAKNSRSCDGQRLFRFGICIEKIALCRQPAVESDWALAETLLNRIHSLVQPQVLEPLGAKTDGSQFLDPDGEPTRFVSFV